jgi:hypothetical protein
MFTMMSMPYNFARLLIQSMRFVVDIFFSEFVFLTARIQAEVMAPLRSTLEDFTGSEVKIAVCG